MWYLLACFDPTWTAQNLEDPLFDLRDNFAFGVETRDEIPEISKSAKVNAKGIGYTGTGVPDRGQDLLSDGRAISLGWTKT